MNLTVKDLIQTLAKFPLDAEITAVETPYEVLLINQTEIPLWKAEE